MGIQKWSLNGGHLWNTQVGCMPWGMSLVCEAYYFTLGVIQTKAQQPCTCLQHVDFGNEKLNSTPQSEIVQVTGNKMQTHLFRIPATSGPNG